MLQQDSTQVLVELLTLSPSSQKAYPSGMIQCNIVKHGEQIEKKQQLCVAEIAFLYYGYKQDKLLMRRIYLSMCLFDPPFNSISNMNTYSLILTKYRTLILISKKGKKDLDLLQQEEGYHPNDSRCIPVLGGSKSPIL